MVQRRCLHVENRLFSEWMSTMPQRSHRAAISVAPTPARQAATRAPDTPASHRLHPSAFPTTEVTPAVGSRGGDMPKQPFYTSHEAHLPAPTHRIADAPRAIQAILNRRLAGEPEGPEPLSSTIAHILTIMQERFTLRAAQCWLVTADRSGEVIGKKMPHFGHEKVRDLVRQAGDERRRIVRDDEHAHWRLVVMPLQQGAVTLGALVLARPATYPLSEEEVGVIELIAMQLAGAAMADRALQAMRERERFTDLVYAAQPDGFMLFDRNRRVANYSQAALEVAANRAEVLAAREQGKAVDPLWSTQRLDGSNVADGELPSVRALAGVSTKAEQMWVRPDPESDPQTKIPVLVTAVPVTDEAGAIHGAIVRFQDITSVKGIERLKQQLIDRVQHEIRAPLAPMLLKTQILVKHAETLSPAKIREFGESMEGLITLINVRLDGLTNLESAVVEPPERMSLVDCVRAYVREQRKHGIRRIELEIDVADTVLEGYWSPREINIIVDNLIQNALKYSREDTPVTVRLAPITRSGKRMALMDVVDRGYGIPPQDKLRIFEDHYRSRTRAPDGREIPGTGRGLNFCNIAVKMHHGMIWADSEGEGKGSAFHVYLPLARQEPEGE
jgi:signal transduction histidine kinase